MKRQMMAAAMPVILATLVTLCPGQAAAQFIDFTPQVDMANRILMDQAVNRSLSRSRELIFGTDGSATNGVGKVSGQAASAKPVLLKRTAPGAGISALVASYPPAQRQQLRATYEQLWSKYPQVVSSLDPKLSPSDLSGSAAIFLLGCYIAYVNHDLPDTYFPALIRQVRAGLAERLKPDSVNELDLYALHEQLGVIGVSMALMQSELAARPNPEMAHKTKDVAGRYLSAFLGVDMRRVRFSAQGLQILN